LRRARDAEQFGKQVGYCALKDQYFILWAIRISQLSRVSEVKLRIFIVQPGLSKSDASPQQLQLLGVTENYLKETHQLPFFVIGGD
jgi:hypothetical protein